jgi:hypothetical protein
MAKHTVVDGDDMLSLAFEAGVSMTKITELPQNAFLNDVAVKRTPTILKRGDKIEVPDIEEGDQSAATESKTTFQLGGVPAELNLVLMRDGQPVKNTSYRIAIDGVLHGGTTDDKGLLNEKISPNDRIAHLRLGNDVGEFIFHLGSLDPVNTVRGLQQRLYNMGFDPGVPDGDFGDGTRKAMNRFQDKNGLQKTTKPDKGTQDLLEQQHGC